MTSNKCVANAVGGKTARACDGCVQRRARWFCAADDAFLCQACDASVHSANPLARRHERVRLKTASFKSSLDDAPSWHKGFTRKARTPRHGRKRKSEDPMRSLIPFVPEVGADDTTSHEENEEHELLYRVPTLNDMPATGRSNARGHDFENMNGLVLPSDTDLADFAADVESLLGKGLENESYGIQGLGLIEEGKEKRYSMEFCSLDTGKVKVEDAAVASCRGDEEFEMGRDPFEISFDYNSLGGERGGEEEEEEEKLKVDTNSNTITMEEGKEEEKSKKKKILLRLDYESVMTEWSSHGTPWFTGERPRADLIDSWPHCMGAHGPEFLNPYGHLAGMGGHAAAGDGGREARVSRYREKRRTRLFSKKIRYEVRKLNAEKRPRMKGRFVKRAAFPAPMPFPLTTRNK